MFIILKTLAIIVRYWGKYCEIKVPNNPRKAEKNA